jgi:hypothetical protein
MYASHYEIRVATADDDIALRHLAESNSKAPLDGPILVGAIAGTPVAAIALNDDRTVADRFIPTEHLLATMRLRAKGMRAVAATPSLRARIRGALAPVRAAADAA